MTCAAITLTASLTLAPTSITDGDTFRVGELRVRVWGFDAPERSDNGGPASTAELRRLIEGEMLDCEVMDIDRYGRTVARCWMPDGRDVACAMVGAGQAEDLPRYSGGSYARC